MSFTTTPNMSLTIPTVGSEPGPTYAVDINNSLTLIDQHDHTPGHGVLITPSAMNINSTLNMQGNDLTTISALTLAPQGSTPSNNGSVYESGVDLFYKDGNGVPIRLTQSGSIAGASGSISGLTAPASASYNSSIGTFIWQSNSSTPTAANMDFAAAIMRNRSPNSTNALTLQPPTLTGNYTLTLPGLPGQNAFLQIDPSGNITDPIAILGALTSANLSPTANITGSQLSASAGILGTQIANGTITGVQISSSANIAGSQLVNGGIADLQIANNAAIQRKKLAAVGQVVSGSSGTFTVGVTTPQNVTGLVLSIVTTGRPVMLRLQGDGNGTNPSFMGIGTNTNFANLAIRLIRGGATILTTDYIASTDGTSNLTQIASPSSWSFMDTTASAGTNGYTIQAYVTDNTAVGYMAYLNLVAYEVA